LPYVKIFASHTFTKSVCFGNLTTENLAGQHSYTNKKAA